MIEYDDNRFGEIGPLGETMKKFQEMLSDDPEVAFEAMAKEGTCSAPKALHVGTKADLEAKKGEGDLKQQLTNLKERMDKFEVNPTSNLLHIPTKQQITEFGS